MTWAYNNVYPVTFQLDLFESTGAAVKATLNSKAALIEIMMKGEYGTDDTVAFTFHCNTSQSVSQSVVEIFTLLSGVCWVLSIYVSDMLRETLDILAQAHKERYCKHTLEVYFVEKILYIIAVEGWRKLPFS